jgi:hypothetical protein
MVLTEFEQNIISKLETKEKNGKKLSKSSIDLYLRNLQKLNELVPIKNLKFLENTEQIKNMLENYKPTTRRSYYISIVSVLSLFKDITLNMINFIKNTQKLCWMKIKRLMMKVMEQKRIVKTKTG